MLMVLRLTGRFIFTSGIISTKKRASKVVGSEPRAKVAHRRNYAAGISDKSIVELEHEQQK